MRGRIAAMGVTALVLAAMVAALGAPAASAACPNEAFRTGPSALLPECRAYEMVTPVDKESGDGVYTANGSAGTYASPSGDGVYFHAPTAYAGQGSDAITNPLVAARLGDAWDVVGIGPPLQAIPGRFLQVSVFGVSEGLGLAIVASQEALAPGAIDGGSNLYLRDNRTGTYTLVWATPGEAEFEEWTNTGGSTVPLVDASADWSTILIEDPIFPFALYEYTEGQLRLAVTGARKAAEGGIAPNRMSADGSRFFYEENGTVYQHRRGQPSLLVSEDGEGGAVSGAFVGATPSGGISFYRANGRLYRFEATAPAGSRVTELTPGEGIEGEEPAISAAFVGEDGTHAYFAARSRLTSDAAPVERDEFFSPVGYDLYVWSGAPGQRGQLRYIGQSAFKAESSPLAASVSPDGRFFGFASRGEVTADAVQGSAESCPEISFEGVPPGYCSNVFLYSYDSGRTACVSCAGGPPIGPSRLGGAEERPFGVTMPRALLDDGTIFFDTPNALSARDADGALDVYAWRDGSSTLISGGTSPSGSSFVEATPDGSDVFFATRQQLVGQDIDALTDLYDARVDGGLPQGSDRVVSCTGEADCRGGSGPASTAPTPGTSTVRGPQNASGACLAFGRRAVDARKRSRALANRAKKARGRQAKGLRRRAAREAKAAGQLRRRAGDCTGAGR